MSEIHGQPILSGLPEVLDPRHTALIIVDVQNDFFSPGGLLELTGQPCVGSKEALANISRLLDAARTSGALVVYLQNTNFQDRRTASAAFAEFQDRRRGYGSKQVCELNSWGWQIVDAIAPQATEIVIQKPRHNGFVATNLDLVLRAYGVKSVVICGAATHGCVECTSVGAEAHDYYVHVVSDATCSFSVAEHEAALTCLRGRVVVPVADEVVRLWEAAVASPSVR